jgi:hypothetical protein
MKTLYKPGRAMTLEVDRRDLATALNRYFSAPFFLSSGNALTHVGRAS